MLFKARLHYIRVIDELWILQMTLTLTENAALKILNLIKEESIATPQMFRITVSGGGCAGFQYGFSLDDAVHEDDIVFEDQGVTVAVDEASLSYRRIPN